MGQPHKHAALIKAWADGAEIQYRFHDNSPWIDVAKPVWELHNEYRIKPKTIRYRTALAKGYAGSLWVNSAMSEEEALRIEGRDSFIKWISDWQEVVVD